MRLSKVRVGAAFTIFALNLSDDPDVQDCPARQFLDSLETSPGPAAQKAMTHLLRHHAEKGPIKNDKQSREVEDGIFEFKTQQGARLLWFYEPGRQTILIHGFLKGAVLQNEIRRAKALRTQFREGRT